ncbi:Flp pilus assembly protein CpaB [Parasulfitobacter algicola]|uniref:Flp pilus assembly protein CpaB n=1 Tax=Parasulfitobacter algicola TaxID=2614809 RepID=A0ABX2IZ73_9RHOB|nr:Flp pilus assembly protein CpaB [Sulfitobacter algicola]NSX56001.1 Flp pilus assembly protein CpaB [Sulfitobacter algicola]
MRLVFGLVLLLGVGLAGFAVFMVQDYFAQQEAQLAKEREARAQIVPTTDVYITARAIRYGERLTKEDVTLVRWPVEGVPEGSFQTEESLFPNDADQNRFVLRALEKGEALMNVKVSEPGADAGIRSRISSGMRAFTVRVDVSSGVSGLLRPGDRVDVTWTGSPGNSGTQITQLIETGLEIIAIDQSADPDFEGTAIARTITVEATPNQVSRLETAQNSGRLTLSLIGLDEVGSPITSSSNQTPTTLGDVLGIQQEIIIQEEEEKECFNTVTRGGVRERIQIPCTN